MKNIFVVFMLMTFATGCATWGEKRHPANNDAVTSESDEGQDAEENAVTPTSEMVPEGAFTKQHTLVLKEDKTAVFEAAVETDPRLHFSVGECVFTYRMKAGDSEEYSLKAGDVLTFDQYRESRSTGKKLAVFKNQAGHSISLFCRPGSTEDPSAQSVMDQIKTHFKFKALPEEEAQTPEQD